MGLTYSENLPTCYSQRKVLPSEYLLGICAVPRHVFVNLGTRPFKYASSSFIVIHPVVGFAVFLLRPCNGFPSGSLAQRHSQFCLRCIHIAPLVVIRTMSIAPPTTLGVNSICFRMRVFAAVIASMS